MTDAEIAAIVRSSVDDRECWVVDDYDGEWEPDDSVALHPVISYRLKPKPREWWLADGTTSWESEATAKRYADHEVIHVREVMEGEDD